MHICVIFIYSILIYVGSDRPAVKYLHRHVQAIAGSWYDIGIELMETEDEDSLNTLRDQHGPNTVVGAKEMLRFWLRRQPHASWNQLISVLRLPHIGLDSKALEIENLLLPEGM